MELNYSSLLNQPHILIAGTTGSGKSNLLHLLISDCLQFPACQFVMIDPKRVELSYYERYGNTQIYAVELKEIILSLDVVINVMESRYRFMKSKELREYPGSHVYVIIDELADLMTQAKKYIQPRLQRIAQLGRAARVHLIAATQAPDRTHTLPAGIKLNFTDRIALRCATSIESKQIIDRPGAECLPQYGQAIYRNCIGECIPVDIPFLPTDRIKVNVEQARQRFKSAYIDRLRADIVTYKKLYPEDFKQIARINS